MNKFRALHVAGSTALSIPAPCPGLFLVRQVVT